MNKSDVAAYIFDRAEQYDQSSGIYSALTELAVKVAEGDIQERLDRGELKEPDLRERVGRIEGRADAHKRKYCSYCGQLANSAACQRQHP